MFRLLALKGLRLVAISVLLTGTHALAQFEVAPDHFDSDAVQQMTAGDKAKTPQSGTSQAITGAATAGNQATRRAKRLQTRKVSRRRLVGGQTAARQRVRNRQEAAQNQGPPKHAR